MAKKSVLFVCHGNICRSPAAEGVFRALLRDRKLTDQVDVDSAGTSDEHEGELPHSVSRKVALKYGIELNHRARQFTSADYKKFNLIVTMDQYNYKNVTSLASSDEEVSRVHMYRSFDPSSQNIGRVPEVPDPYYGGIEGFETVHTILERTSPHILQYLIQGPELKK